VIAGRSPLSTKAMSVNPAATAEAVRDGWLWTGDRALRTGLEKRGFTSFFDSRSAG